MTSIQDRVITMSLVMVESIWLYGLFSVLGILLGLSGSPISWISCLIVYGFGLYFSRIISWLRLNNLTSSLLMVFIGFILIYITVGFDVLPSGTGFSMSWLTQFYSSKTDSTGSMFYVIMAVLCALITWARSLRSGSDDFPLDTLVFAFRVGILVLVVAVTVDTFYSKRLYMHLLMFLFFSASLCGMSFGHIMPSSRQIKTYTWFPVMLGIVATILSVGALLAALQPSIISLLSRPIIYVSYMLGQLLIYLIVVPVAFLIHIVLKAIIWMIGDREPNPAFAQIAETSRERMSLQEFASESGSDSGFMFSQFFEIGAMFIGAAFIFMVLFWAFRRRTQWGREVYEKEKLYTSHDVDPFSDLFRLSKNLFSREKYNQKNKDYVIPEDLDEYSADILKSYYEMRQMAENRGVKFNKNFTPAESVSAFNKLFSIENVKFVTEKFVHVCYGKVRYGQTEAKIVRDKLTDLDR